MRRIEGVRVRQDFSIEPMGVWAPERVPIVINSFNRLSYVRQLVDALRARGYENIYIIDNNSTYESLLQYYQNERLRVFYLDRNVGYLALWTTPVGEHFLDGYYAYTDSDIVPADECPADFIARFRLGLDRYPRVGKVGFGLKIDDLPERFALKERVIEHETQFLTTPLKHGFYHAPIDTTFALYRPGAAGGSWLRCLRTEAPYIAQHLPWYEDLSRPTDEELFYRQTIRTSTHWTLRTDASGAGIFEVPLWGAPVRVAAGPRDDEWNMVSRGEWHPETYDVLDRFLDASHSYLEIGSGVGQTALYASRLARTVYAVEPDPELHSELARNVRLNAGSVHNVEVVATPASTGSLSRQRWTLDELALSHDLSDCRLISIDIEGDEYRLLPTMIPWLRRHRPTLYLTLHPRVRFGITTARLRDRIAVALLSATTTWRVLARLRFYRALYDSWGNRLTPLRLLSMSRGEVSLVATDREW